MKNNIRLLVSVLLAFILCLFAFGMQVSADEELTVQYQYKVGDNYVMVYGYHPLGVGKDVTFLATKNKVTNTLVPSDILYIDQVTCGVNGSFVIRFSLPANMDGQRFYLKMGGTDLNKAKDMTVDNLEVNGKFADVETNSIMIGNDVYELASGMFGSANVLVSMKEGGNTVRLKFGLNWYDLLDESADSSDYLVSSNAIPSATIDTWQPNKWYRTGAFAPTYFDE